LCGTRAVSALSAVLGRAFVTEPTLQWSLGTHGDVAWRFTQYFEYFNETLARLGMLWEVDRARGAAVWPHIWFLRWDPSNAV
jgi:hypothetical protein